MECIILMNIFGHPTPQKDWASTYEQFGGLSADLEGSRRSDSERLALVFGKQKPGLIPPAMLKVCPYVPQHRHLQYVYESTI